MDTGFATSNASIFENCNAGMEQDIRQAEAPYVVKNPFLCDYLGEVLESGEVVIDHALVPMRDLFSAAESRRDVVRRSGMDLEPDRVPGGLWYTQNAAEQETVLTVQLYKLLQTIARYDIPLTLLDFPRLVREPEYLYRKMAPVLPGIGYDDFLRAFQAVSRPDLVHDFVAREGE